MVTNAQNSLQCDKVLSLVSIGRHPQSGRLRRGDLDAKAVEMGLNLCAEEFSIVHAGNPENPVLRHYAGMGVKQMVVLKQHQDDDALPVFVDYIAKHGPQIVLTGQRSESGESSGMLPYLLAEKLAWPMVSGVAEIVSIHDGEAQLLLALPRGQRRAVTVKLPFIASVSSAAKEARQSAFAVGLRASIEVHDVANCVDQATSQWQVAPAKPRAKRMKVVKAKNAAERMKAATAKAQSSGGKVLLKESLDEKAQAIFDLLIEEKVIR